MPEPGESGRTMSIGLAPTELVTVVCDSSVCVNSLMLSLTAKMALRDHLRIALLSPAMTGQTLAWNLLAAESGVHFERLVRGLLRREDWPALTRAAGRITEATIRLKEAFLSPGELMQRVVWLKEEDDLSLIVMDGRQMTLGWDEEWDTPIHLLKVMSELVMRPVVVVLRLSDVSPRLAGFRESDRVLYVSHEGSAGIAGGGIRRGLEVTNLKSGAPGSPPFDIPFEMRWHSICEAAEERRGEVSVRLADHLKFCFRRLELRHEHMAIRNSGGQLE